MTVSVVREIEGVLGDAKRREGLSVLELLELFPDDYHAEAWLCWVRWEGDIRCVDCGSGNFALSSHKKMRFRCRGCGGFFSVKKGTVMEASKLGLQKWVVAIYAAAVNLKGISSRKLAREIGAAQKTAWHRCVAFVKR